MTIANLVIFLRELFIKMYDGEEGLYRSLISANYMAPVEILGNTDYKFS